MQNAFLLYFRGEPRYVNVLRVQTTNPPSPAPKASATPAPIISFEGIPASGGDPEVPAPVADGMLTENEPVEDAVEVILPNTEVAPEAREPPNEVASDAILPPSEVASDAMLPPKLVISLRIEPS